MKKEDNSFCPAPWISMFYQVDKASVCCTSADKLKMSPKEFLKSDYLKKLRQDFIKGDKPNNCGNCWRNEDKNLLSIRQQFLRNFPEYTKDKFTEFADKPLEYVELRCSNQCNFMCRMCNPTNSIEIAREATKFPFAHNFHNIETNELSEISEKDWKEIISSTEDLRYLFLTGGEPLLMKQYYDLMDRLIDNGKSEDVALLIYTNCSVYNPKFAEKITKFKNVRLNLSIDAVGRVAEYQRKGTDWEIVKENAYKLASLPNIKPMIHSTVTAYTVLDMNALIDFYNESIEKFNNMTFQMHVAGRPLGMAPSCLDERLRKIAIEQIDQANSKLFHPKFKRVKKELEAMSGVLKFSPLKDFDKFCRLTKNYDAMRDESFEEVFGYKLVV
jgi:hypothetical protein